MINQQRLVDTFIEIIKIDSPSKNERGIADYLKGKLTELGLEVKEDKAGEKFGGNTGNIISKLKGNTNGKALFLSSHLDTVSSNQGIEIVNNEGIIRTKGNSILGADDKAGIAALLETIRCIKENNLKHGDLEFIFTVGEELGLFGSKNLQFDELNAKVGFVIDSGGKAGTVITKAPGQLDIIVEIHGKEAHSGVNPEDGINAIQIAGKVLAKLKLGRIDENGTANFGIINGGKAINIVPDYVKLEGEVRNFIDKEVENQFEEMKKKIEGIVEENKGQLDIKGNREYHSFEINEDSEIISLTKKGAKKCGIEVTIQSRGGGSDANIFNYQGLSTVNLGIGYKGNHSNNEELNIEELTKGTELILAIIQENVS